MRAVIQRVSRASVSVEGKLVSKIDKGLMCLIGIRRYRQGGRNERLIMICLVCIRGDTQQNADFIQRKILTLRLFPDGDKQWAKTVVRLARLLIATGHVRAREARVVSQTEVNGEILLVSQFTL